MTHKSDPDKQPYDVIFSQKSQQFGKNKMIDLPAIVGYVLVNRDGAWLHFTMMLSVGNANVFCFANVRCSPFLLWIGQEKQTNKQTNTIMTYIVSQKWMLVSMAMYSMKFNHNFLLNLLFWILFTCERNFESYRGGCHLFSYINVILKT